MEQKDLCYTFVDFFYQLTIGILKTGGIKMDVVELDERRRKKLRIYRRNDDDDEDDENVGDEEEETTHASNERRPNVYARCESVRRVYDAAI